MSQEYESGLSIDLKDKRIVLLLQGGGALGAYQVGAFEVLHGLCAKKMRKIDWVVGISIGAINAALIAGNRAEDLLPADVDPQRYPEDRLIEKGNRPSKLEQLWDKILWPPYLPFKPFEAQFDWWLNSLSLLFPWSPLAGLLPKYAGWNAAAWGGQGNFFDSRLLFPWLNPWIVQWGFGGQVPLPSDSLANYSVRPLAAALDELVDWELINNSARQDRALLSLGVTGVENAEVSFLNSFTPKSLEGLRLWGQGKVIGAEHVLASSALPPAFPAVCIDNRYYWDGGLSSNTPLLDLRHELTTQDTIVFDVLLWDRRGSLPKTMDELMWRQKCIQFGSRKKVAELIVENYGRYAQAAAAVGKNPAKLEIVQIMYETEDGRRKTEDRGQKEENGEKRAEDPVFWFGDADFSRSSFDKLRRFGRKDMFRALQNPDWMKAVGDYAVLYRHGTQKKHLECDPMGGAWSWRPGLIPDIQEEQAAPAMLEVQNLVAAVDEVKYSEQSSNTPTPEPAPQPKSQRATSPTQKGSHGKGTATVRTVSSKK